MYLPICVCDVSVSFGFVLALCLKHESFPSVPIRFFVVFFYLCQVFEFEVRGLGRFS